MKLYVVLFLFLLSIFVTHYAFAGQAVYGDGIDYWAYMHEWYFDRNLDFTNEFRHLYAPEHNNAEFPGQASDIQKTVRTSRGFTDNAHPPGVSVVLFPMYVLADWVVVLSRFLGLPFARNGYSDVYQLLVGAGSILSAVLGARVTEKLVRMFGLGRGTARLSALAIVICTPLLFYASYDVIHSHAASFMLSAVFWYLLFFRPVKEWGRNVVLGVVLGLSMMTRNQEVLLVVPLLLHTMTAGLHNPIKYLRTVLIFAGVTITPMLFQWHVFYGVPLPIPYLTLGHQYRGILGVFFSKTNGLLFRTPLLIGALAGIMSMRTSYTFRRELNIFLVYALLSLIVIVKQGGWGDAAYGGRMFITLFPMLAVFLARFFIMLKKRVHIVVPTVLVVLCFVMNLLSITSFVLFEKQNQTGDGDGLEQEAQEKLNRLLQLDWSE